MANRTPTAQGFSQSNVTPGVAIPLTSLFSYSDADGLSDIVSFDVRLQTSNGGHIFHNGVQWPDGQLTPDQPISTIGQWSFVPGAGGADTIGFNVTDHAGAFNPTVTATVTPAAPVNHTPTAQGFNQSNVSPGVVIALTSLFSYSDTDGLSDIVSFDVKLQTSNGGHIFHNGVQWPDGQLTPDQAISTIGQWSFVPGSGSADTIGFNVTDHAGTFNPTVTATVTPAAPVNHTPTAQGFNQSNVAPAVAIPLTSLFSYSDADGLSDIVSFDVKLQTSNGGHIFHNGVQWPDGQLTPDQPISTIGQWSFVPGSGGADTIGFNVTDHAGAFNPTVTATVTPTASNHTPTAQGHSLADVGAGVAIPITTLFSYSDPDGLSDIVSFDVRLQTSNGGHIFHNGVQWPDGQLTPDQPIGTISQWTFVPGSGGSDTIGFNVTDHAGAFNPTVTATVIPALNHTPTAQGLNKLDATPGVAIPLTTLFSYSDVDGLSDIVSFDVKLQTSNGGHIFHNGVQWPDGQLTPDQPISTISQWSFVPGSGGADTIGFNVTDHAGAFNPTVTATVAASTDQVLDNVNTSGVLSTTVTGTIDAEPKSGSTANVSDGHGGLVDKDWFKVTLDKGKIYTFSGSQTSINTGLLDISLYGSSGTQVHSAVEGPSPSFTFDTSYQSNTTQVYYVAVSAGGSEPSWRTATGGYSLSLTSQTANGTLDHIPETPQSNTSLSLGTTLGTIDATDLSGGPDDDYYKVVLNGGERYAFLASAGVSANDTLDSVFIRLHDSLGAIIPTGITSASGPTPYFEYSVPNAGPQTYFLAISASNVGSDNGVPTDAKTGQYSITLTDKGPTNQAVSPADPPQSSTHVLGNGIDALTANRLTPTEIINAHKQFVAEYIGDPIPGDAKYLSANYANSLIQNQIAIVSIFQRHILFDQNGHGIDPDPADITTYTVSQADSDAAAALAGASVAGQKGGAIYFGVDADPGIKGSAAESHNLANVVAYFNEIKNYFSQHGSPFSIGVYGAGDVLNAVKTQAGIQYTWLAYAPSWAGSDYSSASIKQTINSTDTNKILIGNVPVDLDVALAPDIGAWGQKVISSDGVQDAPVVGANGLLTLLGSALSAGSNVVVGSMGQSGVISNGLTGDVNAIFNQFSEILFNGGAFKDTVKLQPLTPAGVADHTFFFNGNQGDDALDGSLTDTSVVATGGAGNDNVTGGPLNDILGGNVGFDVLAGGHGGDTFVFDTSAVADGRTGFFDRVTDYDQSGGGYNFAEGDQLDLSAILAAAYNRGSGQQVSSLVRAVEDGSGGFARVQVDPDGAANGANWVTIARLDGLRPRDSISVVLDPNVGAATLTVAAPPQSDFEDVPTPFLLAGKPVLLWHSDTGVLHSWTLNGLSRTGGVDLGPNPGPSWHVKDVADMSGDGNSDILWQNDNGQVHAWTMNGLTRTGGVDIGPNPGPSWHVKDTADFDRNGSPDILWQNDNGQAHIWTMSGLTRTGGVDVGPNPGASWHIRDVIDLNHDGNPDILWQNDSGQVHAWTMNGVIRTGGVDIGPNPGASWHIKAVVDMTGDGNPDILWQNDNGQVHAWTMNGLTRTGGVDVGPNPGPSWHVKDVVDYNNDGNPDILWQNDNGQVHVWTMSGLTRTGGFDIPPNPGTDWHVIA